MPQDILDIYTDYLTYLTHPLNFSKESRSVWSAKGLLRFF